MGSAIAGALAHLRKAAEARRHRHARDRLKRGIDAMALNPQQRKANLRLALILASVAAVFVIGFVTKMVWLGAH